MQKIFIKVLVILVFSIFGCKSIPSQRTELFDSRQENSSYEMSFGADSSLPYNSLSLEFLEPEQLENFNGITVAIINSTKAAISVKVQMEDVDFEILGESDIQTIAADEDSVCIFEFDSKDEEKEAARITFQIEGDLKDGSVSLENVRLIRK